MDYQDINAQTIDGWIRDGWEWGKPISHEVYEKAKHGEWDVYLTPTKPVPHEWIGPLEGKKILGLASGGGQQMPVFAGAGLNVAVICKPVCKPTELREKLSLIVCCFM